MLRVFCLTLILLAVLMPFRAEVAFSNQPTGDSRNAIAQNADIDTPACYFRREDGKLLDLGNLCGQTQRNTGSATAQAADVKRLLATNQCPGCNLSGANLTNANLEFANLVEANLTGANISGATLVGANLNDANLASADLRGAKLNGARMIGANLNGANLVNANLLGANLIKTNLNGAKLDAAKMPDGTIHN
jgi:uncharacterized protein YjbI with pentapeptide repeats